LLPAGQHLKDPAILDGASDRDVLDRDRVDRDGIVGKFGGCVSGMSFDA